MTNKNAEAVIEMLEENNVIVNVKFNDTIKPIEMVEDFEGATGFQIVSVEDYEANGFDVDGLELTDVNVH